MEQLPPDVLPLVLASLTGFDVFRLSQASAALRRATSTARVWRRFFDTSTPSPPSSRIFAANDNAGEADSRAVVKYKQEYMRTRSLRFRGLPRNSADRFHHDHGAFVVVCELPRIPRLWPPSAAFAQNFGRSAASTSVTIDAWFSLLPASDLTHAGGVLFGAQSAPVASSIWPHYHEQPVLIDSSRRLYCSLLEPAEVGKTAEPVAQLEELRWYHLALSYSGRDRVESVFLDGKLVATRVGDWLRHWRHLAHCQVGTGCLSSETRGLPEPEHLGWYGLNGTVDELRIWEGTLPRSQVLQLASGRDLDDESALWYSLRDANALNVKRSGIRPVRCTRPCERAFESA